MVMSPDLDRAVVLGDEQAARGHLARICFKTGPPTLVGVELEWTVHDAADPARPVDRERLRRALGRHSPVTLDPTSPADELRRASAVTVEPGGQVEISAAPRPTVGALVLATEADVAELRARLDAAGLVLGRSGIDPWRLPRPVVETPRYRAMRCAFDRRGPAGRAMMYSTAGLQVCLDAGEPEHLAQRWAAAHAVGPPLLAAFATADRHAGRATGWASARMATWLAIDPARTRPVWSPERADEDPVAAWTGYALAAPLLCVRGDGPDWTAPPDVTFADWLAGALPRPPTTDDLEYHVSTLFPPVRPRGYLELRYLDAQPGAAWTVPLTVLAALFADPATTRDALAAAAPVADRWRAAARCGLAERPLATAAAALFDLALTALPRLDLPPAIHEETHREIRRRRAAAERGHR
ncbi:MULTISPECIES: ergothioneine biosynthesis glutamate--cysteine ligase EgtA [Micromonospora]|uniref:ergothioneine biosynthesis glutamate--cysteine ligase EgtA n=1 Tax=Micromonospora TaxID=1873 RepID=UPI0007DB5A27|nr:MULTISPECIES: ergothioneine biosynthesis glutamate--cysteine ligase EgtA [Micromonospora]MBQ1067828.1 ergothioneine biosynthesis glutamate--cysteine ligase EgtA [Micromonospora sp. D75]MCK1806767.1 ergothioneine biosynthesis glutamate--cysteine ligase EgtA [Micromonospora sp. R42106]MCK1832416.1 ergothioneine biosynthesis glutamate--cysteine ligase EgtA [Micromonospora sp. R42003]MCK1843778.1 ergothioneine biosynthesis glutamate--cysteine ligase EgtA [Micromonospora sp. R42004]MCM1017343.1 